jgi:hypothetical protein
MYILGESMITDKLHIKHKRSSQKERNFQKFLQLTGLGNNIIPIDHLLELDRLYNVESNLEIQAKEYVKWKSIKRIKLNNIEIKKEITFEQYLSFWQKPCHYCGSQIKTVGLDRIDSKKSYNINNIVSCCWICNRAKMALSYDDFMGWINNLIKYQTLSSH